MPGAAIGLLMSQWLVDAMIGAFPDRSLPYWLDFTVDGRVVLFSIGAAIFTTLVVGVLPALRTVRPNLVHDLKEGGRGVSLGGPASDCRPASWSRRWHSVSRCWLAPT